MKHLSTYKLFERFDYSDQLELIEDKIVSLLDFGFIQDEETKTGNEVDTKWGSAKFCYKKIIGNNQDEVIRRINEMISDLRDIPGRFINICDSMVVSLSIAYDGQIIHGVRYKAYVLDNKEVIELPKTKFDGDKVFPRWYDDGYSAYGYNDYQEDDIEDKKYCIIFFGRLEKYSNDEKDKIMKGWR